MGSRTIIALSAVLVLAGAATVNAELISLRSGQVGGLPGLAGQSDDTVRFLNNNPPGAPISASAFTVADFAGADSGAAAQVINPFGPWTPGISDPLARWINFNADIQQNPDGTTSGSGFGLSGSSLYAVPFFVTTASATGGFLNMEFAVDDSGGDLLFGGGNPDFLYVNGTGVYATVLGNFGASTFQSQFISFGPGWNSLYLYQRDAGVVVSGTIFSVTIDVIPAPGAAALLGMGGLAAVRRRR